MNLISAITEADKGHQNAITPSILEGHLGQLMPEAHDKIAAKQYLLRRIAPDHVPTD